MKKFHIHVLCERNLSRLHSGFICPSNIKRGYFLTPNLKLVFVIIYLTAKVFRAKILTNRIRKLEWKV